LDAHGLALLLRSAGQRWRAGRTQRARRISSAN